MSRNLAQKSDSQHQLRRNPKGEGLQTKHKTELCRKWESGTCEFGSKCAFAHGVHELKAKVDVPTNYKTKKCKPFFTQGFCVYGPRCQFSHRNESKKTAPSTPNRSRSSSVEKGKDSKKRLPIFVALEENMTYKHN